MIRFIRAWWRLILLLGITLIMIVAASSDNTTMKFIGLGIGIIFLVGVVYFIVRCFTEIKEDDGKQMVQRALLERELKQYATFSDGVLKLTKCSPQFSTAFHISQVMHTPMSYNPARYIYTSATVGGITTGGIDKVGGNYVRSGKQIDSGKCELQYWGQKVKQIQLTSELYEKAQNSSIKKYLNADKQIVVEQKANGGAVLAIQIYGTHSMEAQEMMHDGYPSEQKCREIIDWICEAE